MQGAFGTLVWIVAGVGIAGAIIGLLISRRTWDGYGKDLLVHDSDAGSPGERDQEIRELLEARNARRRRRGEAELNVEAEFERLTGAPQIDDELRDEIRQLVIARNHRRARKGQPPLDVEAEISREIASLRKL